MSQPSQEFRPARVLPADYSNQPYLVIWEVTRACELACVHCRAEAIRRRDPRELSTDEGKRLLEEVSRFGPVVVVLTGGDPLQRPDIYRLIEHGDRLGLRMAMTPSGTPRMTPEVLRQCQESGLKRLAVSLDGASAAVHDGFRQVQGSFDWSVSMLREARHIGLSTQVNTTVTRRTIGELDALCERVTELEIALWSIFFLVPVGRGQLSDEVTAEEYEQVFAKMYRWAKSRPFDVKSTAAPHYRRYVTQQQVLEARAGAGPDGTADRAVADGIERAPKAVNDGDGLVFVSHVGDIHPSGFLPITAGNIRQDSLVSVYREHPLFLQLRDHDALLGKCGVCEFRRICGGSRARAHAMLGHVQESEPYCTHIPAAYAKLVAEGQRCRQRREEYDG